MANSRRWLFYKDSEKKWRWKRKANNGRVIEAAQEGFDTLEACEKDAASCGWTEEERTHVHGGRLQKLNR